MSYHLFKYAFGDDENGKLIFHDNNICVVDDSVKLVCLNPNTGLYAPPPTGLHNETYFDTTEWSPKELKEMFGFNLNCDMNEGNITFQLGAGLSWFYYDGVNWVIAANNWNTAEEVDAGISKFQWTGGIKFRVKLTPSANRVRTPVFYDMSILCEFTNFAMEDDVYRSLSQALKRVCVYRQQHQAKLVAQNTVVVPDKLKIVSDVLCYDLTLDPKRTTNIYLSNSGQTVMLTRVVTGIVEVVFNSIPQIHISTDAGLAISILPAVTLQITDVCFEQANSREYVYYLEMSKNNFRKKELPKFYRIDIILHVIAHLKNISVCIGDAIRRLIENEKQINSIGLDRAFSVFPSWTVGSTADKTSENVFISKYKMQVSWIDWNSCGATINVPVAREVLVNTWLISEDYDK